MVRSATEAPTDVIGTGLLSPPIVHPIAYRGDIDGLRALAVVSVILYHMFPSRLPAGGVGVDIFFVISGYLVGGMIIASALNNRFSYSDFYVRRVRRILPALLVVLICTAALAAVPLYPWELTSLAKSGISALFGLSNIFFFFSSDYFAAESGTLPLLHTWSLGVEEQFYILFPVFVFSITKIGRKWLSIALTISIIVSLYLSEAQVRSNPIAAFYLLPSRWWELSLGALAAQLPTRLLPPRRFRLSIAVCSSILMLGSLLVIRPERGFPGLVVLPACIGAALFLISGSQRATLVHRIAALPPARYIGLASYSLYLWHWPVIVLYKQHFLTERISVMPAMVLILCIFTVGFASWQVVERPFRSKMSPVHLLVRTGSLFFIATIGFVAILINNGFPGRFPKQALKLAHISGRSGTFPKPPNHCFLPTSDTLADFDAVCLDSIPGKPNWLLVGDSHAAMLWSGLFENIKQVHFQSAVVFGCEIRLNPQSNGQICNDLMNKALVEHIDRKPPSAVILTWRWLNIDEIGLANLYNRLKAKGARLIIIGPTPEYTMPVPRLMAESLRRQQPDLVSQNISSRIWDSDKKLSALGAKIGYSYLSPMNAMCSASRKCTVVDDSGNQLYFDQNHLNSVGSDYLVRKLIATQVGKDLLRHSAVKTD